ncbi:hypothetical protein [Bradyrhizobium sp. URHC0002]
MAQRGRKSIEALAVLQGGLAAMPQRPDAPYDLADEEAEEWRAIVNTMPPDHFMRGNYPILTQLCRHIVAARRIAQMIHAYRKQKNFNYREYAELLKQQAAESLSIMRLSRSLRLTQQSVMDRKMRHPKGGAMIGNPWDREE